MEKLFEILKSVELEGVAIFVFIASFLSTFILIPKLLGIIHFKNLMDHPDERSSHKEKTPTLGGVTFFISIVFALFIIHSFDYDGSALNIIMAILILFFVGLKDDLMVLSAQTKLWAQLISISFVLIMPELWINGFSGFLGIHEVPLLFSILMSYFIMVFIINAYNLIDGIDGLAGMLGILILGIYAILFYLSGSNFYFLLSVTGVGFLIAFLRYNLSKNQRIFMGDTGSLIVGFLIAILTIRFLAMPDASYEQIWIKPINKFLIALSITFFPIVDVIRVILMRLLNERGPFSPDRCHMHHILVDRGLIHKTASITLTICGGIIFLIMYVCNIYLNSWGLTSVFIGIYLLTFSVLLLLDYDENASGYRKRFKAIFPRSIQKFEFRIRKKIILLLKKFFYRNML
ncbi:MraY family glycosyltransferase [Lutimonas halocynthiae]|uniref:glycosyltransferase family 4 protein n=1 Tax=Lutimonas halocynthiae TaxID=1446477 RepID=UPI0025B32CE2|nr:MraY family glycosyltransferase [Lutimonas halocynthiae]MDN3641077.1 MraY family glycosyltransferase [Lutimonas halocynthiae]